MKPLLLFITLLFCFKPIFAQEALDCGYYGNKTVEERNALFPFNNAKKVVLISYANGVGKIQQEIRDTVAFMKRFYVIEELRFTVEKRSFFYLVKEQHNLSQDGINRLSDILINYKLKKKPVTDGCPSGNLCSYNPHNAVLFYDEYGIVICCYEVCFECENSFIIPDNAALSNAVCCLEAQINEVKKLFTDQGIKYLGNL